MIIFGLIITTFEWSIIFRGSWGSIESWLKPKIESPWGNLAAQIRETLCITKR